MTGRPPEDEDRDRDDADDGPENFDNEGVEMPEDGLADDDTQGDEDLFGNVTVLHLNRRDRAGEDEAGQLRMVEALLFAAAEPLDARTLAERLPEGADIDGLLDRLRALYEPRGVNLVAVAGKWTFRTAPDLAFLLERERVDLKKLSRAASEALAIIAYHQPVTRAEIEEIRGVALSKGTLDVLMETGWIRPRGRRETPGRPMTYGTSEEFLIHFGLEKLADLPGIEELKAAGLLDSQPRAETPLLPGIEGAGDEPAPDDDEGEAADAMIEAERAERTAARGSAEADETDQEEGDAPEAEEPEAEESEADGPDGETAP